MKSSSILRKNTLKFHSKWLPPPGAEPRPAPPGFTPPLPHAQSVSSCSGDPREPLLIATGEAIPLRGLEGVPTASGGRAFD